MSRNVPKLRFKGFEDEWKDNIIGNVCLINTGKRDTKNKVKNGKYPFFVRSNTVERINTYSFDGEAILTAGDGVGVGKVFHYVNCKFDYHQRVYKLSNFNKINGKFLYEIFSNNFKKEVAKYNAKTSVDSVRLEMISKMKIKIPSLQEQEKIVNFLSKVDSIIEKQEKKVQYWNSYKKGMMQKIFSQKIRFKDENGRDYPEWEEEKLGGIGQTYTGLSGKTKDDFGFGNGKYITYVNIFKNTKVDINMFDLVDIKKDEKQNKVLKGDILFTTSSETPNEVGMASVCDNNIENLYLNSFCFGFRLNSKKDIDYIFIGYLLRSPSLRKKISILAQGSTRYNLSKSEFMKIKIQIPCLEEQTKIANFLSNIDNIIEKESKKLEELKQWKKGLLQQMFV
ncbi:restriction endonuclease subunit S [Clostridium perfringens]|uniref:restriction endonuclease subunit S n=1 Tax=Clostridium perfringens TaxID=1502 RepID=UPI0013E2E48B|nr:restriction endonuclease subunit S [Clostridium perfringens]NGT52284.1 restriction endonuclease subunit S [Clostridium perfringens]NGT74244.1 restriction endonuclease subunit S [Clostridium perfringens]NGU21217.1 restriction endonuclease subunit S [Clostridium perfringens]